MLIINVDLTNGGLTYTMAYKTNKCYGMHDYVSYLLYIYQCQQM